MSTEAEALAAQIKSIIRSDAGAWWERHGAIWPKDRSGGLIRGSADRQKGQAALNLNFLQWLTLDVVRHFLSLELPIRIIALKPRQKGSTTWFSALVYWFLRFASCSACVIGGEYSQTDSIWKMLQTYLAYDTFDGWGNTGFIDEEKGRFTNGSQLKKETARDRQAGVSGTFQLVHGTECARWAAKGIANGAEVLSNLLKCVPLIPQSFVLLESTAEGDCYDDETEVLTNKGWLLFRDLRVGGHAILTKDPKTNVAYYQPVWLPVVKPWNGDMINFDARSINLRVTPEHSMWMARQKGKMKFTPASSVKGRTTDYYFDRSFKWDAPGLQWFTLPAYSFSHNRAGEQTRLTTMMPMEVWLRFLGHWLGDGHVGWRYGSKQVVLTQTKFIPEFRASIQAVADCLGAGLYEADHGENGAKRFILSNAQLAHHLKAYSQPKRIPRELLMGLSSAQCRTLLMAIYEADGDLRKRDTYGIDRGVVYPGLDKEFQDDLQELALKAEYASSVYGPARNRIVMFTSQTRSTLRHDNPPTVTQYSGMVYCVTLPKHHLLMVRRKGIAVWSGNCGDFPDRWKKAVDFEDFMSGKVTLQPGQYVRVFAPWFEFQDSAMRLTAEQKRKIEATLDRDPEWAGEDGNREAELIAEYGRRGDDGVMRLGSGKDTQGFDVWEQLAWRRYAIGEECKRDPDVFDQDYPHSWEVAFLKSGRPRFLARGIREMKKRAGSRTAEYGILDAEEDGTRPAWRAVSEAEGVFVRWEDRQPGLLYSVTVDTMTGASQVSGADPDCHSVLVRRNGYWRQGPSGGAKEWVRPAIVARIKAPCRWDIDVLERHVWRLACYYGGGFGCRIVIEMNADRGLTELLKLRGADLYQRVIFNQREQKETNALGWLTTATNRETVVDLVAKLVREFDKAGEGMDIWCPHILDELANFIRKESGRSEAAENWHDDDVLALGISEATRDHATPCADAQTIRSGATKRILEKDGFKLMGGKPRYGRGR